MEDEKKSVKIESIKSKLEQRLLEIEKGKQKVAAKAKAESKVVVDNSLQELRKEIKQLQKTDKSVMVKGAALENIASSHKEEKTKENDKVKSIQIDVAKKRIVKKTENKKPVKAKVKAEDKTVLLSKQPNAKPKESNISKPTKLNKEVVAIEKRNEIAKNKQLKALNKKSKIASSKKIKPKNSIVKNKIFLIIAIIFAALYLGSYFKLQSDLNKEKAALEKKKQEQIDYSKKDVIFKEVEDDVEPDELQEIDKFKDVPDSDKKKP